MKRFYIAITLALTMFFLMFSPWTTPYINFWVLMSFSACILPFCAFFHKLEELKKQLQFKSSDIAIGIISAIGLYIIFFISNKLIPYLLPSGGREVDAIYSIKTGTPIVVIGFLLFFLIGPAEEIFWRGYVQKHISRQKGNLWGYIIASSIYAFAHIWSFNLILFFASFICGLFWGYLFFRYQRLWPVIISHAIWDLTIFVLLPV